MKTENLVEALVADRATGKPRSPRLLAAALLLGSIVSLGVFLEGFGVRQDIVPALGTWRFDLKVGMVCLALMLAFGLCIEMSRPVSSGRGARRLLILAALAALAITIELTNVPSTSWGARLVGTNSLVCLTAVPIFATAPLVAILLALRSGAPASPALAGAAAGFLAAAAGATLYAFHCFDDSPLFVTTWYVLAAIPPIGLGAIVGRWLLRW